MSSDVILSVRDLETEFMTDDGVSKILHGVSFDVHKGRTLGLVGESGCGKSVTALSIMGLLPKPYGYITRGEILYRGTDLVGLPATEMYAMRGNCISIIFQDPMTALNPVYSIGRQLNEVLELHRPELSKKRQISLFTRNAAQSAYSDAGQKAERVPAQPVGWDEATSHDCNGASLQA